MSREPEHGQERESERERERELLQRAAEAVHSADALLIGAGAGMGVDSGLPDFRGNEGFWEAYPPMKRLGLSFVDMASPHWFSHDPEVAWGFYGHRLRLYREIRPHGGFGILRRWSEEKPGRCFVFTSNVDGQFQRGGFDDDAVVECHGSIHHLQCSEPCTDEIWSADGLDVDVDLVTFRACAPLPTCMQCGSVARPNILMFGDWAWHGSRTAAQERDLRHWVHALGGRSVAVLEFGAGSAVPTVRMTCERVAARQGATLIRINPREPEGPPGTISLAQGALQALRGIDDILASKA